MSTSKDDSRWFQLFDELNAAVRGYKVHPKHCDMDASLRLNGALDNIRKFAFGIKSERENVIAYYEDGINKAAQIRKDLEMEIKALKNDVECLEKLREPEECFRELRKNAHRVIELEEERDALREALNDIAKSGYGIAGHDDAPYLSRLEMKEIASKAVNPKRGGV